MAKAVWNGAVIAESDDTVVIDGRVYFPRSSLRTEYLEDSPSKTVCPWKGVASYYDVVVEGERVAGAAWYYPNPSKAASMVEDRVAFWRGVEVES